MRWCSLIGPQWEFPFCGDGNGCIMPEMAIEVIVEKMIGVARGACISVGFILAAAAASFGQVDDICGEFGFMATLDAPRLTAPYVYGRVRVINAPSGGKLPRIAVTYSNRSQSPERITLGRTGNYCFRLTNRSDGTLLVDVDGVEVARRQVASFGPPQVREDFEVSLGESTTAERTGVVSSKYYYPRTERTVGLYKQAADAEAAKDLATATKALQAVVAEDAKDFVGWGLLAGVLLERKMLAEADAAVRRSLELKVEYAPAWVTAGRIRTAQKQHPAAIEIFKHAATLEPENARVYQLLGEAYLLAKQGTLGAEALNKAIELDPVGMAELHLQLAHLYQLAKAPALAAAEYKKFLAKVPDHPDKVKFEKFINENP
ncbi:MAG: hypothetical protein IPM21_17985 [Acidobacteria bacterium]|nr:hypothetical protein [Acidobacteriota bacterium]